jgi:hypothetical protein
MKREGQVCLGWAKIAAQAEGTSEIEKVARVRRCRINKISDDSLHPQQSLEILTRSQTFHI